MKDFEEKKTEQKPQKQATHGLPSLGKGLALTSIITGYILGPLIVIGLIGYFLDRALGAKNLILLASLAIAFITSNVLIYKQASGIADRFMNDDTTDKK